MKHGLLLLILRYSPDKVLAVGAEGGLLEEARYEAVILDVVDVFLLQRTLPAAVPQQQFVVGHFLDFFLGHRLRVGSCCSCCDEVLFPSKDRFLTLLLSLLHYTGSIMLLYM